MAGDLQTRAAEASTSKCDFCEERLAFLYCRADSARLCLECDHHVHAANPLALKHARAPLCECCGERTATLQCEEETRFFCASCEQGAHAGAMQNLVKVIPFSGCVSPAQLASAWKCHATTSPFDKSCWTVDDSLSSILASTWKDRLDAFLPSAPNSYFADRCGSSDHYLGGESARRKVFLQQLEQLQRLQFNGDDSSAGLQQEPFQEFLALSPEQFDVPNVTVEAQTYADVQFRQKVLAQHEFPTSCPWQTRPSAIKGSWNCTAERKIAEARVVTGHDTFKQSSEAYRCLPVNNAKELSWIVPPSSLLLSMENTNPRSEEQIFSAPQSHLKIDSSRLSAWNPVCVPGVHGRSSSSPKEATESLSFNEDMPVSCVKSSNPEIQLKLNHGRGYSSINNGPVVTDCVSAPTSFETESSAQARGSAVVRYKEKRKTRNFDKFVRYESRKARAETRLRVRGRFVKANGFNYKSSLADGIG